MGKMHKKKIAEYAAAEEEKSEISENAAASTEENGNLENIETNGENGGTVKSGKKRKASGGKSNGAASPAKKGRKGFTKKKSTPKKTEASKKQAATSGDEEEYEVKEIVGHKIENGKSMFLVRWKGYTAEDDTWEVEDTLSCDALIEKFKKKNEKVTPAGKSSKKGKKDTTSPKVSTEEYEVEKIINYAVEKNKRIFLIRWKGYKAKYDTWEPESNLNCSEMIEKFMERMQKQQNANFKELREQPKKTKRLLNETEPRYKSRWDRTSKRASKKRVYYGDNDD